MEKDEFLSPDFTSLEMICMASMFCPIGINIPNYDDIREKEGFKNVFISNSQETASPSLMKFATDEQIRRFSSELSQASILQTAVHELLGHGTGKLIYEDENGNCPHTFTDPLTNEPFVSCYKNGEVWSTKFGAMSTSIEECRADATALYLANF